MICTNCKHFFSNGNRPDGIPNGVGFILGNGREITLCASCMIKLGQMNDQEKADFFQQLGVKDITQ